ncbi:ribokinase [Clostridium nigeriense]|uniref:ribokinase n=1 Tax=Clostridium nigeriense TaxID=1805470 RepID=UPI000833CA95|nr:ribokinase [Clostridium nigeriense]
MKKVVVVGSLNMDLVMEVNRIPKIGETIKGDEMSYLIGGKGSNQAVAACRLGNEVSMIGCVGKDTFGDKILKHLKEEGVNVNGIKSDEATFTGIATIFKTKNDNSIVVIPGANDFCDKNLIDENIETIKSADILVTQLEIPMETVEYALKVAKENGVKTILNPAPAREISKEILKNADFITPNETEFEIISNKTFKDGNELEEAMIAWQNENPSTRLVVTRGKDGSSYVEENKVETMKTIKVDVVDTTGAGDTFNGALAHGVSHNLLMNEAVTFAGTAASLSVTKFGAQTGMPKFEEVNKILNVK